MQRRVRQERDRDENCKPERDTHENELSLTITCSDAVRGILTPTAIMQCNQIVKGLTEDDPALVVQIVNYQRVHLALGVPHLPAGLVQGVNPEASFENFRDWLILSAARVAPHNQVGGDQSLCWHHLSEEQTAAISLRQWHNIPWVYAIHTHRPAIPLPFCDVLKMVGTGPARAHMYIVPQVFMVE